MNIDEDTSGYLSDSRTSPIMWSDHQPQTLRRTKNYSNYMYPDSVIDASGGMDDTNNDDNIKRQISHHQQSNANETAFTMPM